MGSWGSREVTTQTRDLALPLTKLFANFICLGFIFGIMMHDHDFSIWTTYFDGQINMLRYLRGMYFGWYVLTWYIVYVGIYVLIIEVLLRPFLFALVGYKRELQVEILIELFFGLWVCGQILGSWMDWNRNIDCLITHDCDSYFMQHIMYMMESTCEYFAAYEYDAVQEVYYLRRDNVCYSIFHSVPTFMMTLLSTSLSYLMLLIIR